MGRIIFFTLLAILALPAAAARRSKNFRRSRPAPAEPAAPGVRESPASPAARPKPGAGGEVLAGRWTAPIREALERFLAERGKGSPSYDPERPPVAVLPWSDAAVSGDPAEQCFLRQVSRGDFRFGEEFWGAVPEAFGRHEARAAHGAFSSLPSSVWPAQPSYGQYRKAMLRSYLELCRKVGRPECRSYLARVWVGYKEEEAEAYAAAALAESRRAAAGEEIVSAEPGDPDPVRARRGLREISEMKALVAALRRAGVDVWVIDDVPQAVLLAGALSYGIDRSRARGIASAVEGARLRAATLKPLPWRGGKAEISQSSLGRPPDLAFGRDAGDAELLGAGGGLRIVFSGDPRLEALARERGWLIQPRLAAE